MTASERLTRFVLHDFHFNAKTGRAKPNCFGHVNSRGCSIQRETVATTDELVSFLKGFFAKNKKGKWLGVLSASCGPVREIEVDRLKGRAVCVYDAAILDNPAHGEICRGIAMDPDDRLELQHALFVAFGNGVLSAPSQYRNGDVHARLGLLKATPIGDRI